METRNGYKLSMREYYTEAIGLLQLAERGMCAEHNYARAAYIADEGRWEGKQFQRNMRQKLGAIKKRAVTGIENKMKEEKQEEK